MKDRIKENREYFEVAVDKHIACSKTERSTSASERSSEDMLQG